jgi:pimeloyl-ACP methyl ester carboxylesterase
MPWPHCTGTDGIGRSMSAPSQVLNGYLQLGHGERKVLLMGGAFGYADDWHAFADALDPAAATYVFFDYRGYGRSIHLDGAFNFEEAAQDALRLVDHLGWQRFSLIGHSMGGVAIQRVMLAAPERIERMVAITAVPACSSKMDEQRLAGFGNAATDLTQREFILNFSTGRRLPAAWIARLARQSASNATPRAFGAYLREWATVDFSEQVQGNATPLKVLIGEHDATLTAELMQRTWLSWYTGASMDVLANSGHYPMHEVPLALAAAVQNFLLQS